MNNAQSEIARLMQQIELESRAMQLGMSGYATVARHDIIARRYETIGHHRDQLATLVGEQQATALMAQSYSNVLEGSGGGTTGTEQS